MIFLNKSSTFQISLRAVTNRRMCAIKFSPVLAGVNHENWSEGFVLFDCPRRLNIPIPHSCGKAGLKEHSNAQL